MRTSRYLGSFTSKISPSLLGISGFIDERFDFTEADILFPLKAWIVEQFIFSKNQIHLGKNRSDDFDRL
jgi:hypothetical protein